jgi:hypothetical protein
MHDVRVVKERGDAREFEAHPGGHVEILDLGTGWLERPRIMLNR